MICIMQTAIGKKTTVLKIDVIASNKTEKLTAYKALMLYSDHEVVLFTSNWVVLRASD